MFKDHNAKKKRTASKKTTKKCKWTKKESFDNANKKNDKTYKIHSKS